MTWTSDSVEVGSIRLHYHRTGGDRPALVLLHGITDNGLCWTRLARALEAEYDVVMPDCRGHGLSDAPARGYSVEALAADVVGLSQGLGLTRPVLLGHSMGADTATFVAAHYPDQVRAILLEDPPWRDERMRLSAHDRAMMAAEWRASIHARREMSEAELTELCQAENPTWDEAEVEPWAESKRQVSPHVAEYVTAARPAWRDLVGQLQCPGLLITGDPHRGSIVTPNVASAVQAAWPLCRGAPLAQAGHSIRRDQFEAYLRVVTEFLAEVSGS